MKPPPWLSGSLAVLLLPALCLGDEKPAAGWDIHTVVTTGSRTYEGKKTRAVLVYGEIGNPIITIESIRVEMGYPSPNQVIWQAKIDISGDSPDPCPIAEMYCAYIKDLRWSDKDLHYDLVAPATTLRCRVQGVEARTLTTTCEIARGIEAP
jgi:hypothetical protein